MKYNNGDMVKIKNITLGHGDEWNGKIGVVIFPQESGHNGERMVG